MNYGNYKKPYIRVLDVRIRVRGGGWQEPSEVPLKQKRPKRLSELPRHGAVQDEVDRSIQQRQKVHQLAEQIVAFIEKALPQ